jgi:hypothetical protein
LLRGTLTPVTLAHHAEEAYTDELIEQILENYTFKCEPEVRLKLKHRLVRIAGQAALPAAGARHHACCTAVHTLVF